MQDAPRHLAPLPNRFPNRFQDLIQNPSQDQNQSVRDLLSGLKEADLAGADQPYLYPVRLDAVCQYCQEKL